jgi:hypothetical protein
MMSVLCCAFVPERLGLTFLIAHPSFFFNTRNFTGKGIGKARAMETGE